jgi:hypothetical protein
MEDFMPTALASINPLIKNYYYISYLLNNNVFEINYLELNKRQKPLIIS